MALIISQRAGPKLCHSHLLRRPVHLKEVLTGYVRTQDIALQYAILKVTYELGTLSTLHQYLQ